MSKRYRKLNMETMEARQMMAGDVMANVTGGTLYLNEATGQAGRDNSVIVSQIAPGKIRVTGNSTTTDGTLSKINGAASQDFNVTGGLVVRFGGGSDLIVFDQSAPPAFTNVDIDTAAPPVLAQPLVKGATGITPLTTPDNDNVIMWGAKIAGNLTVNTGAGDDWVYVANTSIGGNVSINTGSGADTAQLENMVGTIGGNVDIQLYSSLAEKDADCAWLDHVYAYGNINARGGDGADLLHLDNVTSYKDFNLDAGAGDDKLEINTVCAVDDFFAQMGDGNDAVTSNGLYIINGKTQIDGGAGTDSITKTGAFPTAQLTQSSFEWVNGRPVGLLVNPVAIQPVMARV
jgi:hypothetical protein